jgi:DNA primase
VIPDSFKQELLHRVDIVDAIERHVPLKKGGANFLACCPFHSEKTPSFTVSPTKQFYHCFGCGAHGNAISFLMEYSGLGYVDAVRELAESVGMKMPEFEPRARKEAGPDLYEIMQRACDHYREQLKVSPRAIDYLKSRGLSGKIAARFGIGYAPPGWQSLQGVFSGKDTVSYGDKILKDAGLVIDAEGGRRYDRFRDRIMFPILDQRGAVIAFGGRVIEPVLDDARDPGPKYLNSPETPLFEKGRELYGLPQARSAVRASGRVVVVEGYMDVVALAQHGVEFAVATLGTSTSAAHVQRLLRQTDEIVFCFDGDAAGAKAAWHALEVSLPNLADHKAVRFLFLPPEHDPDSFVRERGREAFEQALAEARPLSSFLIDELKRHVDMGTLEGRARLVHEAKPLLQRVGAPVLQLQLLQAVAGAAGMTQEDAARLCEIRVAGSYRGRTGQFPRAPERALQLPERRTERKLVQCLLAKPELAMDLPMEMLDRETLEGRMLAEITQYCRRNPAAKANILIEEFREAEFVTALDESQAALLESKIEPEDMAEEFHGTVALWRQGQKKSRLDTLTKKSDHTDEERAEIRDLLQELKQAPAGPSSGAIINGFPSTS